MSDRHTPHNPPNKSDDVGAYFGGAEHLITAMEEARLAVTSQPPALGDATAPEGGGGDSHASTGTPGALQKPERGGLAFTVEPATVNTGPVTLRDWLRAAWRAGTPLRRRWDSPPWERTWTIAVDDIGGYPVIVRQVLDDANLDEGETRWHITITAAEPDRDHIHISLTDPSDELLAGALHAAGWDTGSPS